jgi:SAM-dependent methyltransferase
LTLVLPAMAIAQQKPPFEPQVGQAGKDVVWVPTPQVLVEKMLDLAKVTPQDVVVDLGSGDGRNIIAAARRGARARGVEFNPDMVALSTQAARDAGVEGRATFVQGDMFAADFSDATVLALFLLPDNLDKLRDKFAALKPGTRIVVNTFGINDWEPEVIEKIEGDCASWCTAMLYIVPAQVGGTWRLPQGELMLNQSAQKLSGTLSVGGKSVPINSGKVLGDQISFSVAGAQYTGRINGTRIEGVSITGNAKQNWTATRGL